MHFDCNFPILFTPVIIIARKTTKFNGEEGRLCFNIRVGFHIIFLKKYRVLLDICWTSGDKILLVKSVHV